jgi:surface antigen
MSSVASWESSDKSKEESKDGNNEDSKQSSNKESKDGNNEDSKQSSNQEFRQDSSGVVDDGTNMPEYGWGSGNDD